MNSKLSRAFASIASVVLPGKTTGVRPAAVFAVGLVLVSALVAAFLGTALTKVMGGEQTEFELGRVADRDIVADKAFSYVDEDSTRLRREAQQRLVPAVYRFSEGATRESLSSFDRFVSLSKNEFKNRASPEAYRLAVQAEFPGAVPRDALDAVFRSPSRAQLLDSAASVLRSLMEGGVFAVPSAGLEGYNPDSIEVARFSGGAEERDRRFSGQNVTLAQASKRLAALASSGSYPSSLSALAPALLKPFVAENVFYSSEDSAKRLEDARARVQPVVKRVERGERVVKKGTVIGKEDQARLEALDNATSRRGPLRTAGVVILLLLTLIIASHLFGPRVLARCLKNSELYLIAVSASVFLLAAAFADGLTPGAESLPTAVFLPTAMFTMLLSVLVSLRASVAFAFALPTAAFICGSFDTASLLFALVSGIIGSFALQGAERRMDLINAGVKLALAQTLAAAGVLFSDPSVAVSLPTALFWSGFNGFACGMAALAFLPLFEHALNSATPFRLIELSDLNSPPLKRLLTAAPGTYSHSVTVANLAESACRDIGANALLARVGAYYHDIGKMDQPDYFVENQGAYNRHDDMQPRLSATVIRSHVKLGVEKAHRLGLPKEVIDIIAEHHGNSVISWFYNEALKREDQVSADDFSYPGSPPRSRESAVVMLADTVEAAVRTLKKPTMSKLDKFVQELIMSKFEQDQLSECELTFRDLQTIKNAFVRALAGHYHSRIEYPKLAREAVR